MPPRARLSFRSGWQKLEAMNDGSELGVNSAQAGGGAGGRVGLGRRSSSQAQTTTSSPRPPRPASRALALAGDSVRAASEKETEPVGASIRELEN